MKNALFLAKSIALTSITVASLWGQVDAFPPPVPDFGMIGGARGQTLRLNIVNRPAPAGFPPGPTNLCQATIGFADASGGAWPPGPYRSVDLAPGQAAFVQFDFDRVLTQFGQRLQLRPVVIPAYEGSAQGCVASAEMFDQFTGRTMSYAGQLPPPSDGIPPPILDFGMVGGALLQAIRLNVVAWPPGPTRVTLGFAAADGSAVGRTVSVDLARGQAAHFDLPMSGFNLRLGERVQIRPIVQGVSPGGAGVLATVEVYDVASGRTTTFVPPPVPNRTVVIPQ